MAQAFADAMHTGRIALGSPFPSQMSVSKFYNVSIKEVERAWIVMKEGHKIITTNRRQKTKVVSKIPGKKKMVVIAEEYNHLDSQRIVLDQDVIPELKGLKGSFETEVNKRFMHEKVLTVDERTKKVIPGLIDQFRAIVNDGLGSSFTKEEIYYSQDYYFIIFSICKALMAAGEAFVMADATFREVKYAVKAAKKKTYFLDHDASGLDMNTLQEYCSANPVGVIYIGSRLPYPEKEMISKDKLDHLLTLQELYKFYIIFDDRYLRLLKAENFWKRKDLAGNPKVIYLRPLSRRISAAYAITLIAANIKIITKIKKQFIGIGVHVESHFAYSLLDLLKSRSIQTFEIKANREKEHTFKIVVKELRDCGLFKEDGLSSNEEGFIYLEPINGTFHEDVHTVLERHSIHTFKPDFFNGLRTRHAGIPISLPLKRSEKKLIENMQMLITLLKSRII